MGFWEQERFWIGLSALALMILVLSGCESCGGELNPGGGVGDPCVTLDDCDGRLTCLDGRCQEIVGDGDADADVDFDGEGDGDSDADADGGCPSRVFCGSPAQCCAEGEDCYEEQCVAACASSVRCGDDGLTCCGDGEVCLDTACVVPGDECGDSFDCPEGWFCEPTLGQCLPQPEGPLCEVRPDFEDFEPIVEWSWEGWSLDPTYRNVAVAPAVADIDLDGTPEVVFGAYPAGNDGAVVLVVVSGDTGVEELVLPVSTLQLTKWSGVALGQLDGDPQLEIVALSRNLGVAVVEPDGTISWSTDEGSLSLVTSDERRTHPTLANFDDDDQPEILVGAVVIDDTGELLLDGGFTGCNGEVWCQSAAADLDGDGVPEVIGGNRALALDGSELWRTSEISDGYPAVADINLDGVPDVVAISSGEAAVLSGDDGRLLFGPLAIPGGGRGGPPTVADFDGDGRPEFATAGEGRYAVYDLDCTDAGDLAYCSSARTDGMLWDVVTQDISSSVTGSSVFDFEGDGAAEVVYNDECFLRVYDGSTGETLMEVINTSRTAAEFPLVVDVDGDNNSEFVVPSNNDQIERDGCDPPGTAGVRAFGDSFDRWVRTRPVWNQHTYHVTNVGPDGTIPTLETANWTVEGLNNYRQNSQGEGVFNAPDLVVVGVSADMLYCPSRVTIQARVANRGSLGVVAGVPVAFYLGTPPGGTLLSVVETTTALLPGASEFLELVYEPPEGDIGPWDFYVIVDDDVAGAGVALECAEDNNEGTITDVECFIIG